MRLLCGYAFVVLLVFSAASDRSEAAPHAKIIPETAAARHGLARPWFTQVQLDIARGKVTHLVLYDNTLFVQTDRATLQAIDAETGQTLWVTEVGNRNHPSLRPAVNGDMVGIINGSNIFVLSRYTGRLLWQREIEGAPGAGPALSDIRAYVPTTDGLVLGFHLEVIPDPALELGLYDPNSEEDREILEERRREGLRLKQDLAPPVACQSFGRALVQPLITRQNAGEEYVAWPTDRGYLFVGRIGRKADDHFQLQYKLETDAEISARPTFLPAASEDPGDSGVIFTPSRDGFLHAVREKDGSHMWRFSTGDPVVESAAPIGDRVYVATALGGMYCLEAQTGKQLWWSPGIMRFVALGQGRVYVEDRDGNLVVLHGETGGRLDKINTQALPLKMMNLQTDRIFLASESGLVQCLHEIELNEPVRHLPKPVAKPIEVKPNEPTETEETPESTTAPDTNPFASDDADNPFGGGAAPSDADPFGGGAGGGGVGDPFGGGAAGGGGDPFGGGSTGGGGGDPFGGGSSGGGDPFGGGASGGGDDPFGGGSTDSNNAAGGEDPFAGF